jgi:tetratricopeptide (TPR) repeat protein
MQRVIACTEISLLTPLLALRDTPALAMRPARQKPNEACGCGSGKKHKKCCGGASANAPGAAADAFDGLDAATSACMEEIDRLMAEREAAAEAGEWARAKRRATSAVAIAGDGLARGSLDTAVSTTLAYQTARCLAHALDGALQAQGRPVISELEDVHARICALLEPPHRFWARGLTRLSHARWRDAPLDEQDVRLELPAAVAAHFASLWLRNAHASLGLAYMACGRLADMVACYERALAACAQEPPGEDRELAAAELHFFLGQCLLPSQPDRARACFHAALAAAERAGPSPRAEAQRAKVRHLLAALARPGSDEEMTVGAEELAALEEQWACAGAEQGSAHTLAFICRRALCGTSTAAVQLPWLLRSATLPGAPEAAKAVAMLGCRACGAAPAAGAKHKLCSGCARVAYCGAACQKADWSRHKRLCVERSAEAALADATCVVCRRALMPDERELAGAYQPAGIPSRCQHYSHAACYLAATADCPACVSKQPA